MNRVLRMAASPRPFAGLPVFLVFLFCRLSVAHAQVPAAPFSSVVVFGDSLSDTGNVAHVTQSDFDVRYPGPDFNYTDGRFTDGFDTTPAVPPTPNLQLLGVWHEQLAKDFLGITPTKNSLDGGLNYAYGDATTEDGTSVVSDGLLSITVENMGQQVTDYLTRSGASLDPKALFILWGGGDDLFGNSTAANIVAAPARLTALANRLAQAGAVYILIPNLPPLGSIPGNKGDPTTITELNAATIAYNTALSADLDALQTSLAAAGLHVRIYRLDIYALFQNLVANPATYGFTDVTDSAQGLASVNPDTYVFWDDVHPTTAGHYNIAVAADSLMIPGVVLSATPASSSSPGEAVTFKAVVSSQAPAPTPTGTVTFYNSGTNPATELGTGTLDASGTATSTSSTLAPGTYQVVAIYDGDAANLTSTSNTVTYTVTADSTTTTLTSSLNPAGTGQIVVLTATVAPSAGAGVPTGTVTFLDGTTSIGSGMLGSTGAATLSISTLGLGSHSITASYSGDANDMGSVSAALTETVVTPSITLSANPASLTVVRGESVDTTITSQGAGGLSGFGTLACINLPVDASCGFAGNTVLSSDPNTPMVVVMTVFTKKTTTTALLRSGSTSVPDRAGTGRGGFLALLLMPWIGVAGAAALRRKKSGSGNMLMLLALGACSLAGMAGMAACGSSSNETPAGTYRIGVTLTPAAGGAVEASVTIPVTVQ